MDKTRFTFVYVFLAMLGVLLLQDAIGRFNDVAPLPYSEFQRLLKEGKIKEIVVAPNQIRGELKEPLQGKTRFTTTRVEPELAGELSKYDVKYSGHVESTWLPLLLSWVVPIVLFAGVWVYLTRKMSGRIGSDGLMSIGKSKAKIFVETDTKVTLRRRRGGGRGEGGAPGDRQLPQGPEAVRAAGGADAEGGAPRRSPGDGEDAAGARGGGGGGRPVLLDQRLRVRRDVRRRGGGAGARPVRAGAEEGPLHHLHRRARRPGKGPGRRPDVRGGTTRRSRRSTSSWWSSTASTRCRGSSSWRRRTGRRSSTRPSCARGGSTGRS